MTKIYLVQGSAGWYDDYHTYPVKAFSTEELANVFVNSFSNKYNKDIDKEYQDLSEEYVKDVECPEIGSADSVWDVYGSLRDEAEKKAFEEISEKYPDYDLNLTDDFHGYHIVEVEYE